MSVPILVGIPLESNIIIPTSLTRHIRLSDLLRTQIKIRMCGLQAPDSFIVNSHELSFPCGSPGKESTCHAGYLGSISGLGRFPWRRERLPTPVFWLGEFHGLYSPWGHKESDTTEQLSLTVVYCIQYTAINSRCEACLLQYILYINDVFFFKQHKLRTVLGNLIHSQICTSRIIVFSIFPSMSSGNTKCYVYKGIYDSVN